MRDGVWRKGKGKKKEKETTKIRRSKGGKNVAAHQAITGMLKGLTRDGPSSRSARGAREAGKKTRLSLVELRQRSFSGRSVMNPIRDLHFSFPPQNASTTLQAGRERHRPDEAKEKATDLFLVGLPCAPMQIGNIATSFATLHALLRFLYRAK